MGVEAAENGTAKSSSNTLHLVNSNPGVASPVFCISGELESIAITSPRDREGLEYFRSPVQEPCVIQQNPLSQPNRYLSSERVKTVIVSLQGVQATYAVVISKSAETTSGKAVLLIHGQALVTF